jgi:tetratricopeptide (TPR) repeat protein
VVEAPAPIIQPPPVAAEHQVMEEPAAEEPMEFESEVASEHVTQPEPAPGFPEEPAFAAAEEVPPESVAEPAPSEPMLEAQAKPAEAAAPTPSFGAEAEGEGLFDLAAELEKEDLGPVAPTIGDMSTSEKYGFEDMFKSFKEGVSKVVSDTDASTHYDLGIAYKEMGLCEDAVREFQTALKAGHSPGDCRIMIGLCYTERGKFEQAIEEYEQGVTEPKINDKEKAALFYELGLAWMGLGDLNKSLRMFEKCQSLDGTLRDVGDRVNELRGRLGGVKPEIPPEPTREEVSWESAALKQPESGKTQQEEDDAKKKKGKKISYV